MDTYRPSAARKQKGETAPKEADMIPVMNLFLTIIPALMLMMVVTQVALLALNFSADSSGGAGSGAGGGEKEKKIEVHLMLRDAPEAGLYPGMEVREPNQPIVKMPFRNGTYDYAGLDRMLKEMKARNPNTKEIAVVVNADVLFDTLIRTIDLCKNNGFTTVHYKRPQTKAYIVG